MIRNILVLFVLGLTISFFPQHLAAQGCVAIRQMGGCSGTSGSMLLSKGQWQIGSNYRWFRSFRHFKGAEEQTERLEQHTEVINNSHSWDINATYGITNRLSVNAAIPFTYVERSSLYEHGGQERHKTFAGGIADVRIGASYWLFDPLKSHKGNIAFGLGVKFPTGDYNAQSKFYNIGENGATVVKAVDQSIQPGDGGFGFTVEVQGFQQIYHTLGAYGNAFYLFNPRETNGVLTGRKLPDGSPIEMSVPDQMMARAGLSWMSSFQVQATLGGRFECVPVYDAFGGSNGFRRPGYVLSVEPGLAWYTNNLGFSLTVPYALERNRTQSVTDKQAEQMSGQPKHGDAAFADYSINAGIVWRFGGKKDAPMEMHKFDEVKH